MKLPYMIVAVLVVLGGGSAAAYFGYYMNPNTIWSQSLSNTGKGYTKLISYLNTQSAAHYTGFKESGSFKVVSGTTNYDGSLSSQSSGKNSTTSLKLDLGVTKLDLEARSIQAAGASEPDVYLQLSCIKGLSNYIGVDLGPQIDALDGQWIVIDHNLIADLEQQEIKTQSSSKKATPQLTWADINSFLQAAGRVNQQYLFSTNKATAVTTIVKKYGMETVSGHRTYHYKIGFVAAHVKAYATALCSTLQHSALGAYIQNQTGQAVDKSSECKSLENGANHIKSSDTVDVWADVSQRLLYKVHISDTTNPAENFVDVGLNYKGGDSYPFFISGQMKDKADSGMLSIDVTLNSDTNVLDSTININISDKGSSPLSLSGNFSTQPSSAKLNLTPPTNAESLTNVLSSLGLSQYLTQLESSHTSSGQTAPSSSQALTPMLNLDNSGASTAMNATNFLRDVLTPTAAANYRKLTAALFE